MAHPVQVEVAGGPIQQFNLVHQLVPPPFPDELRQRGVVGLNLGGGSRPGVGVGGKVDHLPVLPVVDSLELLAAADGPIYGIGVNAKLMLQFLTQLKGVPRLSVHLVDKRKDGDIPHGAHLEQLSSLGLHTLGPIDNHNRAVRRHERTIGVLREVLVAGGIQNVDAETFVLKLHHRGGHRDPPLFFNLHPVGGGRPGIFLSFHLSRLGNGPTIEQKFFRQGGLARVRVRDDGKGAAALNLSFVS